MEKEKILEGLEFLKKKILEEHEYNNKTIEEIASSIFSKIRDKYRSNTNKPYTIEDNLDEMVEIQDLLSKHIRYNGESIVCLNPRDLNSLVSTQNFLIEPNHFNVGTFSKIRIEEIYGLNIIKSSKLPKGLAVYIFGESESDFEDFRNSLAFNPEYFIVKDITYNELDDIGITSVLADKKFNKFNISKVEDTLNIVIKNKSIKCDLDTLKTICDDFMKGKDIKAIRNNNEFISFINELGLIKDLRLIVNELSLSYEDLIV